MPAVAHCPCRLERRTARGLGGRGKSASCGTPGSPVPLPPLGSARAGMERIDINLSIYRYIDGKPNVFPSCILPGDPRNILYCQWRVNQGENYAECTRTRAQQGLGPSLRVPRPAPPSAGSGDGSGSREAAAGRRSRVCRSRVSSQPPGAAGAAAALLQSPESWAETRRVWLRDSGGGGGGPSSPPREETLAVRPLHLLRGPFKVFRLSPRGRLSCTK